jgi:aryl-alcohol dehydrogenase-like predicted oxidoreductase
MTFGRETTERDSNAMMDQFVTMGGNFIDTANVYSQGKSEEIVGRWLQRRAREDFVIATKVRFLMGDGPNSEGLTRKHILDAVDASLKRLQTDTIDLYQVHMWDPGTPLEETLSTLNYLVQIGKVRYIGASNYKGWQLQKAIDISKQMGWEAFVCLQPLYNLLDRVIEWELIEVCENEGVGIIPWSPLRGGWLTGKFTKIMDAPLQGTRIEAAEAADWGEKWSNYDNPRTWSIIDVLLDVAQDLGKSPAQIAINWLLNRPGVTAPIIGARNMDQLMDNLGASDWKLSEAYMARLNAAGDIEPPYPYDMDRRLTGRKR